MSNEVLKKYRTLMVLVAACKSRLVATTTGEDALKVPEPKTMNDCWIASGICTTTAREPRVVLGFGRICVMKASPAARTG